MVGEVYNELPKVNSSSAGTPFTFRSHTISSIAHRVVIDGRPEPLQPRHDVSHLRVEGLHDIAEAAAQRRVAERRGREVGDVNMLHIRGIKNTRGLTNEGRHGA